MSERRIRSIPPGTRIRIYPVDISVSKERRQTEESWLAEQPERDQKAYDVQDHVFKKEIQKRPQIPLIVPEAKRIMSRMEIYEGYNSAGDLALVMQFDGIGFMNRPVFTKSRRDYGPNCRVFYTSLRYKNDSAFLILSTFGDIFESQVVPRKRDVNPLFQEEVYLPKLTTTYDAGSMGCTYNNGLVIVAYTRLDAI